MEALRKSFQALEVCEQIQDFQALIFGVIVDSPSTCRAVVEGGEEGLPLVVLRFVVTGPTSAAAAIESSVLEENENVRLTELLAEQEAAGRSCCDTYFAVSSWIAQLRTMERSVSGIVVDVEESSEDVSLKDSRVGMPDTRGDAPEFRRTLAALAAKSLGDNLLLFEGLEEVPLGVKGRIFEYLIKSRTLSSAKLNVLVTAELTRMNLSGPCHDLIRDVHCGIIARATGMKKLNLEGCAAISPEGWSALSALSKLEDLNVANTNATDDFVNQLPPTVRTANFSNCTHVKASMHRFVQRSNRLVELDVSGCSGIPWSVCASMLGLFWPGFQTLRAANSGDMTGTVRSAHRMASRVCKCRECVVEAVVLYELPQLRNAQCNGVVFDLSNCIWIAASVLPISCSFPYAQQVKFGPKVLHEDAWAFASLCPQLRYLDLSCPVTGIDRRPPWTGSKLLTEISFGACAFAKPEFLQTMLSGLPLVEKLTLVKIPELTLQRAVMIVTLCPKLTSLHLEDLPVDEFGFIPHVKPRSLSYLKLANVRGLTQELMEHLCHKVFPGTETVVLRGASLVSNFLFLHHDTRSLTLDRGCMIAAPLNLLAGSPPLRLRTLQLLDWSLAVMFGDVVPQQTAVHPELVSLDISRGFQTTKDLHGMATKERALSVLLFQMFPNLKLLTARHQFREYIEVPKVPAQLKTISLCLTDSLRGPIPKKCIYRATCAHCEAANGPEEDDDDIGFSLFD